MTTAWTDPATPVALTTITVAFYNVNIRDNLNVLRANTGGGDPTTAGQVAYATGAGVTAWGQLQTASYADTSITPAKLDRAYVNKAGDTMSSALAFAATGYGVTFGGGGQIRDETTSTSVYANNDTLIAANEAGSTQLYRANTSGMTIVGNTAWHAGNDGVGSGLDADLVHGVAPSSLTVGSATQLTGANGGIIRDETTSTSIYANNDTLIAANEAGTTQIFAANTTTYTYKGNAIWHAGNDGSGSGLDADTLRTLSPSNSPGGLAINSGSGTTNIGLSAQFLNGATSGHSTNNIPISDGTKCVNLNAELHDGLAITAVARLGAASNFTTAPTISGNAVWHAGNDGAGSGLDADTIDGIDSTSIALLNGANDFSVAPTIQGDAIAKIKQGSYSGNNSTQTISGVGFTPADATITDDNGALIAFIQNGKLFSFPAGGASAATTVTINADGWVFANAANGANSTGHTYHYTAHG